MLESWMISAGSGLLAVAFGYGIVRNRLDSLEKGAKSHLETDTVYHHDMDRKLDAQFRRIDDCHDRATRLESKFGTLLDEKTADSKFVSKHELALHLKNIDSELAHMTKNSDVMLGKLEELTKAFSTYMLRELNDNKDKE